MNGKFRELGKFTGNFQGYLSNYFATKMFMYSFYYEFTYFEENLENIRVSFTYLEKYL